MFKNMVLALERIEKRQRMILEKLRELEKKDYPSVGCADSSPDKGSQWVQKGIDSILAYQVGKKKEVERG